MYYHHNDIISYKGMEYMEKIKLLHSSDHISSRTLMLFIFGSTINI